MTMTSPKSPSEAEYLACQLPSWYSTFSQPFPNRRKGLTFQTRVLDAPDSFRPYLVEDGVRLPPNTKPSSCLACKPKRVAGDSDDEDSWSEDSSIGEADEHNNSLSRDSKLTVLTDQISEAIKALGGFIIPKLNWSSPKDASWINEGTLKCQTAGDVYLLLKSSDFVSSDLELIDTVKNQKIQIILRKWANLYDSQEFRCFVKDKRVVAISQRQADQHFEHLPQEKDELLVFLEDFLEECVFEKFASGGIPSYVVDVYVDRQDRVWIVDFNVWGERTDSLLFSWEELNGWGADKESEIRVVETEKEIRPHPLNNFRAPMDTVHVASITGGSPDNFQALMDLCQKPGDGSDHDDEGETE